MALCLCVCECVCVRPGFTNQLTTTRTLTSLLHVQSADDFSERSLRVAEVSRDQKNLAEEEEEEEEAEAPSRPGAPAVRLLAPLPPVNGEAEQVDFIDSSMTAEEEEDEDNLPTPTLMSISLVCQHPPLHWELRLSQTFPKRFPSSRSRWGLERAQVQPGLLAFTFDVYRASLTVSTQEVEQAGW